jgi:hypothetical protein
MRIRLLTIALAASLLGGCSATPGQAANAPAADRAAQAAITAQSDLLYVSNQQVGEVDAYIYQNGEIGVKVLSLTGFHSPSGMCSNKDGDVFITDNRAHTIFRYKHDTLAVYKKLHDPDRPSDCSINPVTADLAVADSRNVRIYPADQHESTIYTGPESVGSLAYDNVGNLFVSDGEGALYELPAGGSKLEFVTIKSGPLQYPLGMIFTNPYLLIFGIANEQRVGYKLTVSNGVATIRSIIQFQNAGQAQTLGIRAGNILFPDRNVVSIYSAKNGKQISQISNDIVTPYGAVVSEPPPR